MPVAAKSFSARYVTTGLLPPPADGPPQIDYFDPDQQPAGFGVRVSRQGSRTWIYIYRYNGTKRRMKLGGVGEMNLAAARDAARDANEKVRKGLDPATEIKKARVRVDTVSDLAAAYVSEYAKRRKSSWQKDEQILNREVIPFIGKLRAIDVTQADIRDQVLKPIVERGSPVRANHTLEVVRKMYNWGIEAKDLTAGNPAARIKKPGGTPPARTRYLSPTEMRRYWAALEPDTLGKRSRDERGSIAFKLLLLTGQREMELLKARWQEIDFDDALWTIPANNAKSRKEHILPLTPYVVSLLQRLRALTDENMEYVFESSEMAQRGEISHVRRVFYEKRIIKIREAAKLDDFKIHDLRRTATTYWRKLGISREIKKSLLNHVISDVTAIYDRFEYLDEKRAALVKWEEFLLDTVGLLTGRDARLSDNIVVLSAP